MVRYLLYAALLLICAGALQFSGCGGSKRSSPMEITASGEPVQVASVTDLGVIEGNSSVTMRDGGHSVLFQGKSLWIFGDTVLKVPNEEDSQALSNSCAATWDLDAGDGLNGFEDPVDAVGAPREFYEFTDEELAFNQRHRGIDCEEAPCGARWAIWPGTMITDTNKNLAYVFYHKVLVKPGLVNFTRAGHSIAVLENLAEQARRPLLAAETRFPTLMFQGHGAYGSASVVMGNVVYIFGCELRKEDYSSPCHLGRVPLDQILERDAWRFLSEGDKWVSDHRQARGLFSGSEMMTVFFNRYLQRYIVIYSQPMGRTVMMRTATQPGGPWSDPLELFVNKAPVNELGWVYDAIAHPEMGPESGRTLYISYSRQVGPLESEFRLVAVELR